MRLTTFSDYALRLLMYVAASDGRVVTIAAAARAYGISRAHVMKVANILTRTGYLKAVRGRSGGLVLARPPQEINIGAVVRDTEPDFALVECFADENRCAISECCKLSAVLQEALASFLVTLDGYTLDDLLGRKPDFMPIRRGLYSVSLEK